MNKVEIKEQEEIEQLKKFIATKIGEKWFKELGIIDYQKSESPDFIMKTQNNEIIALEITKFITKNKNLKFSQALTTIGNKICREAEKEHNLRINILIDKYDDRKFSIHWKDHLDLACDPGFSNVPNTKLFKQKLQDILKNNMEKLKKGLLVQEWLQVENDYFQISMDPIVCPWTGKYDCHVNNSGMILINPINELQNCIDKKNNKIKAYNKKCSKCYLLITVPDSYNGNYCSFDNELIKHRFNSEFEKIFLYCVGFNTSYVLK